jgi:hypothetical protein
MHDRGLDKDVAVVVWGNSARLARQPRHGQDHWPEAERQSSGGGPKTGQAIGETTSDGAGISQALHPANVTPPSTATSASTRHRHPRLQQAAGACWTTGKSSATV